MDRLSERWMYYCGLLAVHGVPVDDMKHIQNLIDAEEQGLLLRLPCKVGDTVWEISRYLTFGECGDKADVWHRIDQQNFTLSMLGYYGKTVFLTKEEAEQALARMEKENE